MCKSRERIAYPFKGTDFRIPLRDLLLLHSFLIPRVTSEIKYLYDKSYFQSNLKRQIILQTIYDSVLFNVRVICCDLPLLN